MPRVVPSQVVELIDKLFPGIENEPEGSPRSLSFNDLSAVNPLVQLAEQIPAELLVMDPTAYSEYVSSLAALKSRIRMWETQGNTQPLDWIRGLRKHNPVKLIRLALEQCPDESPALGTLELNFITDAPHRERLRLDVSATNAALANGEWKAATVLAGSVVEALLLWALEQVCPAAVLKTVTQLAPRKFDQDIQKWVLAEYIDVAEQLKIIKPVTIGHCRFAKDFRNLIHPGRAQRLGQPCNRGTALSAVAAVEHVVNDLIP